MRVGLLGELEVLDDQGRSLPVAGAKQRALLAILALQAGRVVLTEQLVDALWGEDPPAGVRNSLQGLASKLRRTLGSADLVTMRSGGYTLELPSEAIDVHRFEEAVAAGRAAATNGDLHEAARLMGEADALWRGDPLSDFAYDDFATSTIARLGELRLAVLEEQLDLELQLGRHQPAVVQLEELVTAHPLRERLRGLLMVALYRSGRQADALRVFQEGRQILGEELGLEPGPELRRLEASILAQEPSLDSQPAAPTPARPASRADFPQPLTPLIGRDAEVLELLPLLAEHRLVTLVGPGGVGKTRLALEVARNQAATLQLEGCLVELAPVGDPAGVRGAIASALDLPDPGRLAEMIGDRELLVVLDNCEHVITAAAEVAEALLQRCPGLRLVATSREGLRVPGETVWPVPPLADGDASRLFVERARASGAPIELTADTSSMIHDICRRLDGLPLAIELAAARTRAFPIAQVASRLNDRFRLLTGGARTALPRQQTLRAVVDWSYDLLFEDEQRVFERLAVFPGGCDLAAAEVVCADDTLDPDDVHDVIEALVEKSLVIAVPTGAGLRFTQLQTLAHYGREKLAERGEAEKTRGAMAAYFKALCAESASAYIGDRQRTWLTAIDQEQDNLRAALEWAVDTGDAETALTIAGGASWPHWLAGTIVEGRRWIDAAFACAGEVSDTTRALGLVGRGLLEFLSGAPQRADADLEQALQTFQAHDDFASTALAFSFYAEFAAVRGEVDEARRRRQAALDHYAEMPDDPFYVAVRSFDQGKLAVFDGDLAGAEAHYRAAAEGFAQVDRPVMLSISLGMVADFDERAGDHAAAIRVLDQAIATNQAVGLRGFTGSLLVRLGWSLLHVGDLRRAQASYEQALEGARRTQNGQVVFFALAGLAVLHRSRGEDGEAAAMAAEALEIHLAGSPRRFRNRIDPLHDVLTAAAAASSVLAVLAAEGGDGVRAARLLGLADQLRADAGASLPPFLGRDTDRAERLATDALGQEAFRAALEEGRRGELGLSLANPA